jgi:hypothetical protein
MDSGRCGKTELNQTLDGSKDMNRLSTRAGLLATIGLSAACSAAVAQTVAVQPEEAETIARDAYVYGFPMVMNYKTMWNYVVDEGNPEYKGPFNEVSCEARLFTPEDKAVVTPNADTPYCMFWMDLRAEPLVLSVPEIDPDRYYSFQLIDLYTHNFGYVGNLTTGSEAGRYLLAGPGWDGTKPAGITDVIRSETDFILNITRTQLFGPDDLEKVKEIQGQYELEPLSTFLGEEAPAASARPDFPEWDEGAQFDERFFAYLDFVMDLLGKPGPGEEALWQDLAKLGIGPGMDFRLDALPQEQAEALKAGVKDGFAEIEAFIASNADDPLASGKWFGTRSFLNESASDNYGLDKPDMLRSAGAHAGLYGNSAKEAIYPTYFTDADKRAAGRLETQLHDDLSEGRPPAGEGLLVPDHIRRQDPALHRESARPLSPEFGDDGAVQAGG